ncbi:SusC/RagA family TonB-linked outer membrane protein [Salegentibacter maritimus]|uniref:SusC/RagA family TonB-linked outer membrane protein n=1 Tax=Salegentibacter maritimus TaxID=2794347 RepID=A0ABS0TGD9_9FLAO|nr:SusC/RagA family TonB-linked outer membrane protein [Salegentibacter maritimus]MBI6120106.1 SusC/RagA family TonB-linked outer membrane protein [Salegentibacter maritimus]
MKKSDQKGFFNPNRLKFNLKMKLTTFLLLVSIFSVQANIYSQKDKVSLNLENVEIKKVLESIESLTDLKFFYNHKKIDVEKMVSVEVVNKPVSEVLDKIFDGTFIYYTIEKKQIILKLGNIKKPPLVNNKNQALINNRDNVQQSISGTVSNTDGPLLGVNVFLKGSINGTQTDFDGNYVLDNITKGDTIVFSFIGYRTKEIKVGDDSTLDVVLDKELSNLDEVVVTALGIKRESRALGYAVSNVTGDDLNSGRQTNAVQALAGKVAGVDISGTTAGPSGSTRVVIRGNSELSGNNNPLYVIDGVPMDNSQLGEAGKWGGYDYGDGLSSILPEDIESISVLKGASAAALYGSRATHGVILITTKSGQKKPGIGVEYSSNVSVVEILSHFDDYQREYGQGRSGILPMDVSTGQGTTQSSWGAKLDPSIDSYIYNGELKPYENVPNNILSFFRRGLSVNNSVSLSSSNGFRASISDMSYKDIVPNSDMRRNTFMIKGGATLGEKLKVEGKVNYTRESVNNRPALSDNPNNIGNAIIGLAPNFNQKWLGENYKDEFGRYIDWNGGNIYRINPYWAINEMSNESLKNRVMGYLMLNYKIAPYLTAQIRGGTDFYNFKAEEYSPYDTPTASTGSFKLSQINVNESNFEGLFRFNKQFNKLHVSAFVGGNIRLYQREAYINQGFDEVQSGIQSILNYREMTLNPTNYRKQVNSVYGSVNLGYNKYAYIDFSLRNDISSTLSADNRSYFYPSVSGSFVFSTFFNLDKEILSFGKVRASWAQVGGDTSPYRLNLTYGLYPYTFQGNALGNISTGVIPNKNLKPTETTSYEFGTDLRFFNGRLNLDAGYYRKSTTNQILNLSTSSTTGYKSATINSGEIVNQGIEIALSATPFKTKNFEWNASLNYAKNINEVVKLHPNVKNYELAAARWAGAFIYASEGEAYGNIVGKGFRRDGNGNIIFKNGLPTYESDLKTLGNGVPDFTLGLLQSFRYKRFSLKVLFDMKWKLDIYSMSAFQAHANGTSTNTLEGRAEWYNSEEQRRAANVDEANWTPTGGYVGEGVKNIGTDDAPQYVPNDVYVNPQDYWTNVGANTPEPFIYDGSYIKLREVNLSYSLPKKTLLRMPLQSITFSIYGSNLAFLFKKVKNFDPESNYNTSNGQGLEYGSLPSRRNLGFSINAKF